MESKTNNKQEILKTLGLIDKYSNIYHQLRYYHYHFCTAGSCQKLALHHLMFME